MKIGEKKRLLYVPVLEHFIDADCSLDEIMKRVNAEEAKKENEEKKELRKLQQMYPGRKIVKLGSYFMVMPE